MRRFIFVFVFTGLTLLGVKAQDSLNTFKNSADLLLSSDGKLKIGGYGEVHYNQPFSSNELNLGTLDVHRLVMLFGYQFNDKIQFISEIEYEHVTEVYIEQAFIQYKINDNINLRGGLLLTPMGLINEYHEPTTFNSVERPSSDKYIVPTTWREIGFGVNGNIIPASIKYQLYLINGFNGYDGEAKLSGKNGLRKGRQKGAESYIHTPSLTGKIEFYRFRGLNIGLSAYYGHTQSTLYDKIEKKDHNSILNADSSVVGITMAGSDLRYNIKGFQLSGQLYYVLLSNTKQYNEFTKNSEGIPNDLGSSMTGFYVEIAYNIFRHSKKIKSQFLPFIRYEELNTHNTVDISVTKNNTYHKSIITSGFNWKLTNQAVFKADIQFFKAISETNYSSTYNMGFGVIF